MGLGLGLWLWVGLRRGSMLELTNFNMLDYSLLSRPTGWNS